MDDSEGNGRQAIEELAARLYWRFERVAPEVDPPQPWDALSEAERQVYRNVVSDLSRSRDLWDQLDELARDDGELGQQ